MFHLVNRVLKDITTTKNGKDYCFGRVVGLFSLVAVITLQAWALHKGQTLDIQSFCIGLAAVLTAIGANIMMKAKTEPDAISDTNND